MVSVTRSQIVLDGIPQQYLTGIRKLLIRLGTRILGDGLDVLWVFGNRYLIALSPLAANSNRDPGQSQ
jgi:hypothetical protein